MFLVTPIFITVEVFTFSGGGDGWGGEVIMRVYCTHMVTYPQLMYCAGRGRGPYCCPLYTMDAHLQTWLMLRKWWGGAGEDDNFLWGCKHGRCYASDGMGLGGMMATFLRSCTHGRCYANTGVKWREWPRSGSCTHGRSCASDGLGWGDDNVHWLDTQGNKVSCTQQIDRWWFHLKKIAQSRWKAAWDRRSMVASGTDFINGSFVTAPRSDSYNQEIKTLKKECATFHRPSFQTHDLLFFLQMSSEIYKTGLWDTQLQNGVLPRFSRCTFWNHFGMGFPKHPNTAITGMLRAACYCYWSIGVLATQACLSLMWPSLVMQWLACWPHLKTARTWVVNTCCWKWGLTKQSNAIQSEGKKPIRGPFASAMWSWGEIMAGSGADAWKELMSFDVKKTKHGVQV